MSPKPYAKVALFLPLLDPLDYAIPPSLQGTLQRGMRVMVPLGPRKVTGCVVDLLEHPSVETPREILEVLDASPLLSPDMLALTRWMADYYCCTWGEAIRTAFPGGVHPRSVPFYTLTDTGRQALVEAKLPEQKREILALLLAEGELRESTLRRKLGRTMLRRHLRSLEAQGYVQRDLPLFRPVQPKRVKVVTLRVSRAEGEAMAASLHQRAPRQAQALRLLLHHPSLPLAEMMKTLGGGYGVVPTLGQKGVVEIQEQTILRIPSLSPLDEQASVPLALTPDQAEACAHIINSIEARQFRVFLLHGVTGSGKTEIYLQTIARVLQQGRDALVLVPEIALTPQLVHRFYRRFPGQIAVLHSKLSAGERLDTWKRIQQGKVRIVIGVRSALFAPLPRLGIIVVDEEHDSSYKQEETPRYQARDLAIVRARLVNAVVLLGSATPSLESFFNARQGKYTYLSLPHRIGHRPLPPIEIVDMRQAGMHQSDADRLAAGILSRPLRKAIQEALSRKEQVLLFLNRRGYAAFLQCQECGYFYCCPRCSVSLTYHRGDHTLRCHYCYHIQRAPDLCSRCRGNTLRYRGVGTERVERIVEQCFPQARIARMDRDTTRSKSAHTEILQKLRRAEIDILIGTQMITKGHDFPGITLVGILSADSSLTIPDFRAAERTFQLITQVAGRAGRGDNPGLVIVQTYTPEHYAIQKAQQYDSPGFYEEELRYRAQLTYPPYARLVVLRLEGEQAEEVEQGSKEVGTLFRQVSEGEGIEVLGPAPAIIARIKNRYRWQLLLKGAQVKRLHAVLQQGLHHLRQQKILPTTVSLVVDVDPVNLL
ncbi:MAG: primosomal protein N' [Nitrospinota bacterium]|nr:MAG: primosomal protein N' [Nitrospinota bacterium]